MTVDVLQVITSTARRGAERFAASLEPLLVERGLTVRTVALTAGAGATVAAEVLGTGRLAPPTLRQLRRAASSSRVVVAHGSTTLPASVMAMVGMRRQLVYRNIGDPLYWSPDGLRRWRTSFLLRQTDAVVALTERSAERMVTHLRLNPERLVAIPRGVDPIEFPLRTDQDRLEARSLLGIGADQRLAVTIGALSPEKAVPNAIMAVGELAPKWHLLIAGAGPSLHEVEAAARAVGPDRVSLVGAIDSVLTLLQAADLLILPSDTEGLPGVAIEAAMVGVPTVATDVGFVRDIVVDGETGVVVPPGEPSSLAAGVVRAEGDLQGMGGRAHRHALEHFGLPSTADRWCTLLNGIMAGAPVR